MKSITPNHARRLLRDGRPVVSPSVAATSIGDLDTLEWVLARGLSDLVWVEMEHGPATWHQLSDIARTCDLHGVTSIARVMTHDPAEIGRTLDRGIQGIAVPHVNTKAQAEAIVEAALYAPEGARGMSFPRQSYGVPDFLTTANDEVLIIALLEEHVAFENLDDLLTVERIDCFFLGPVDLAQTMGAEYLGQPFHPDVQAVITDAITRIVAAGRSVGTLVTDETVAEFMALGVRFLRFAAMPYLERGLRGFRQLVEEQL